MAKVTFTFEDRKLRRNVEELPRKIEGAISAAVDYTAAEAVVYMKSNAPWTDRTGAARSGLTAIPAGGGGSWSITLAHAVHYGIWLEVKFSARDAIIMPTARVEGGLLMARLNGIMGGL